MEWLTSTFEHVKSLTIAAYDTVLASWNNLSADQQTIAALVGAVIVELLFLAFLQSKLDQTKKHIKKLETKCNDPRITTQKAILVEGVSSVTKSNDTELVERLLTKCNDAIAEQQEAFMAMVNDFIDMHKECHDTSMETIQLLSDGLHKSMENLIDNIYEDKDEEDE